MFDIVLQIKGTDGLQSFRQTFAGAFFYLPKHSVSNSLSKIFTRDDAFRITQLYHMISGRYGFAKRRFIYIPGEDLCFREQLRAAGLCLIDEGIAIREAAHRVGISRRTMQRAKRLRAKEEISTFLQAVSERIERCCATDLEEVEDARRKLRNATRTHRRRRIFQLFKAGVPRTEIMRKVGVSSSTLQCYLSNMRKAGSIISFRRGPAPGSKLDGSAWQSRRSVLTRAFGEGCTRDEMALLLSIDRRRLSKELGRLRRETGEPFPLPWKHRPRPRPAAA